jgi:ubiquinone/menaquinone biosynthesis C-methylase UbiE
MIKSTERFSDRVADYIKYRPSYPQQVVDCIVSECQIETGASVADIGSGTGIFSQLLLAADLQVFAVEPNESMRSAAEHLLSGDTNFTSIDGRSESTNLADASIDLITAAQAFHWFEDEATKLEFSRILKPGAHLALVWNQRNLDQPFQQDYERMLRRYAADYNSVNHMNLNHEDFDRFVYPAKFTAFEFENSQHFDLTGFLGRMQSSSYTPKVNTREHEVLMKAAENLFNRYESDGAISFAYTTRLYIARFNR